MIWNEFSHIGASMVFVPSFESNWSPTSLAIQNLEKSNASILVAIWLTGTLVSLARQVVQYGRLKGSLQFIKNTSAILPPGIQLPKHVALANSPLVNFPAVFGFAKAYLILPVAFAELPESKKTLILKHELFHIQRKDFQVNAIRLLVKSLFWFNPLIYVADKYFEADQEISCDLGVLENANEKERKHYASVLLETMSGRPNIELISQWKFQSLVKERIKMLKNTQRKKWHAWIGGVLALLSVWGTSTLVLAQKQRLEPMPIEIIEPRYPREAAEKSIEGFVEFEFNLDSQGYPYEIKVIDSKPELMFRDSAINALRQWRFKTDRGQTGLRYTMEFKLQ